MPHQSFSGNGDVRISPTIAPSVPCGACPLRCSPAFRAFSSSELQFVSDMKRGDIVIAAGDRLIAEGRKAALLYTLYDGWAIRFQTLPDGSRQILDFVLPGDLIGLPAYLLGSSPYSVRALTPAKLCALDATRLPALFRSEPDLAMSLMVAGAQEQQRGDARLTSLGRMGASERVGYLMLELRTRLKERGLFEGQSCAFPVRRAHLADAVGLSKAHLMRALRNLRVRGLADLGKGVLTIPSARELARFAGYPASRAAPRLPIL